jgi:hypothetical protein
VSTLDGCWAKFDRAKEHVETIRTRVLDALGEDPVPIPLTRRYNSNTRCVVYAIGSVPKAPEGLGVVVGDAIHNFRSALDHLWWQLAIRNLREEPTDREAPDIQFPILSDPSFRGDPQKWTQHRYLRHVDHAHVSKIEAIQPYNQDDPDATSLAILADLSNVDKHRVVHVVLAAAHQAQFQIPSLDRYVDCVPDPRIDGTFVITSYAPESPLRAGNEILVVPVTSTGPNPDVDLHAWLTGTVVVGQSLRLMDALDAIGTQVETILKAFDPLP